MTLVLISLALFGACIGSFTNGVVWRLPRQESPIWPGSHCPSCGHAVRWHDNVPVLGWLRLRGRCRDCSAAISARYPIVETFSGCLWVSALMAAQRSSDNSMVLITLLMGLVLVSLLLPLVLIDLDHLWLPEPICRAGVICGVLATALLAWGGGSDNPKAVLLNHLIASATGLLVMESLSALAERILGQPALGLGDAKLAAVAGAWRGLGGLGISMALAVFSGAAVGTVGRWTGRLGPRQPFPFGPFIAFGIWMTWLMGASWWWQRWLALMGGA